MRNKIVHYNYDEENKCTWMGIRNKYGTFYAGSEAVPQDYDVANKWTGGRLAEYKCDMQTLKAKYKIMKQRAIGIETALNNVVCGNRNSFSESNWNLIKKFERQANVARKEANEIREQYQAMKKFYSKYAEQEIEAKRKLIKTKEEPAE